MSFGKNYNMCVTVKQASTALGGLVGIAANAVPSDCCDVIENEEQKKQCKQFEGFADSGGGGTVMAVNIAISIFALYLYKKCNKTGFNAGELCWACCCPLCYIFYKMVFENCL